MFEISGHVTLVAKSDVAGATCDPTKGNLPNGSFTPSWNAILCYFFSFIHDRYIVKNQFVVKIPKGILLALIV